VDKKRRQSDLAKVTQPACDSAEGQTQLSGASNTQPEPVLRPPAESTAMVAEQQQNWFSIVAMDAYLMRNLLRVKFVYYVFIMCFI